MSLWLWFTVVFANFAEAIAEGRGKAEADSLRKDAAGRGRLAAGERQGAAGSRRLPAQGGRRGRRGGPDGPGRRRGDRGRRVGQRIGDQPAKSAPVYPAVRPATGRRSPGGTTVLSDRILVRITANPWESFLDRIIGLVEGASRQKTPNEIALHILLVGLTLIFLFACVTLVPIAAYSGIQLSVTAVIALLVCLIPTTIGALLSAIGIAGMDRALQANIISKSGKAVELAGDIDVVLLDKTGTITIGNRKATTLSAAGVRVEDVAEAAQRPASPTRRPRGAPSWSSRRSASPSEAGTSRARHASSPSRRRPA